MCPVSVLEQPSSASLPGTALVFPNLQPLSIPAVECLCVSWRGGGCSVVTNIQMKSLTLSTLPQSHGKLCTTFALKFLPGQTLRPGRVKADLAECQDS